MKTILLLPLCLCVMLLILGAPLAGAANIGVVYSSHSSNLPAPEQSVKLFQIYKLGRMFMADGPDQPVLHALHNTTIQLALSINNDRIHHLATGVSAADNWIRHHLQPHLGRVYFRYIVLGRDAVENRNLPAAMANFHEAISKIPWGFENTKITTVVTQSVLGIRSPPSQGQFYSDSMSPVIKFLLEHDAPLMVTVQPYFEYINQNRRIPLGYTLFSGGATDWNGYDYKFLDGEFEYENLFDEMIDAFYSALEKAGAPNVRVAVAETGWPTAEGEEASWDNARTYNWKLIDHVLSGGGTPRRPGIDIETYIYSLFNEDEIEGDETLKNFGIFDAESMKPFYALPNL